MDSKISIYLLLKRILSELNEQVVEHGERVAFLEIMMAKGRNRKDDINLENLVLTCFAHDIGAYKTDKFLNLLKFDAENTLEHCIYGYLFMKYFSPLKKDSEVLLYHHTYYKENIDSPYFNDGVLIHLLDRIDVLNVTGSPKDKLIKQLINNKGTIFNPDDVDDFIRFDEEMHLIDSLNDGSYKEVVRSYFDDHNRDKRLLLPIIDMLAYEVDFKSEQTVIHTLTMAYIAKFIGRKLGLSENELQDLYIASKLHDLGKIYVPTEILEKPAKLTEAEYEIIKLHPERTRRIIADLFPENIVLLAYRHHERLDGSGYPNHLKEEDLTLSERIIQVADVASALIYRRSYKNALDKEIVVKILNEEKLAHKLDALVIDTFINNYDEILASTVDESKDIISNYENLQNEYRDYLQKYSSLNHETDLGNFTVFDSNRLDYVKD